MAESFAEACFEKYQGKTVEINTGESKTTLYMADFEIGIKSVIRCVIKEAISDALIVDAILANGGRKELMINAWNIISIAEVSDNVGIKGIYRDEDALRLRSG